MRSLIVLTVVFVAALSGRGFAAPAQVAVTTCGQIVPDRTVGYLTGDLDCSGYTAGSPDLYDAGAAVTLGLKSELDLRGFTLTAGIHGVLCDNVRAQVRRTGCAVYGGTIVGGDQRGIGGFKLDVHDVTVTGSAVGIDAYAKGRLEDIVVDGGSDDGVRAAQQVKIERATITNNDGNGIASAKITIRDSTVTGNAAGASCAASPGTCGDLASARRPRVKNTVCGTSVGTDPAGPATWGVCSLD